MKTVSALLATIVACTAFARGAQTPQRDRTPTIAPSGSAALAGVVAEPDGKPVKRAQVALSGDMKLTRTAITDDAGVFSFPDLPAGRFTLTASKGGYPDYSYGATRPYRPGSSIVLAAGQKVTDLKLKLAQGGVLTGVVYDERGQTLPGVPLMAWEVRTSLNGERTLDWPATGGESVVSDDHGRYRVFGLPPGDFTVGTAWFYSSSYTNARALSDADIRAAFAAVTQPPTATQGAAPAPAPPGPTYNYTPVFAPNSTDPLAAQTYTLAPGDVRDGVDIHMQFRPTSHIAGVVVSPVGALMNRTEIRLVRRSAVSALNSTSFFGFDTVTGRFQTESLAPGFFTMLAESPAEGTTPAMWARQDVTLSGPEPVNITLTLQPALSMPGRVIFDGTTLTPPSDMKPVSVSMAPLSPGASAGRGAATIVDATGTFTIIGLTPGTFRVRAAVAATPPANPPPPGTPATPAATWVLSKVMQGDQNITDLPIDVGGINPSPIVVTFTDRPAELSGIVQVPAGQVAADYFVVAFPADKRYWIAQSRRIVSARPDVTGRYTFRNLPPGDYRVAATTDLVTRDLSDASVLEKLNQLASPVTVSEGEKKSFSFKIGG